MTMLDPRLDPRQLEQYLSETVDLAVKRTEEAVASLYQEEIRETRARLRALEREVFGIPRAELGVSDPPEGRSA